MADKIAITKHLALRTMWFEGFDTESLLTAAHNRLKTIVEPTPGYVYAEDVAELIETMKKEQLK